MIGKQDQGETSQGNPDAMGIQAADGSYVSFLVYLVPPGQGLGRWSLEKEEGEEIACQAAEPTGHFSTEIGK